MPSQKKILVVDDSTVASTLNVRLLKELGFSDITTCEGGNPAWKLMSSAMEQGNPYQIILCDWLMPDGSGMELIERVRADNRYNSTFFCMITAESEAQNIVTAVTAGINAFVIKPVTADELRKKLKPFIES